ncbi:MAG: transcription antitermination factor NusB [Eggerthellaceae bacterium]|nr:transcription antitermination factor NusB [Eggerthellaceae bacterium]
MAARTHEHTKARQAAVKVLYSAEICELSPKEIISQGTYPEEGGIIDDYALTLIEGVEEHVKEIDEILSDASENWAVSRMPIIDRCVLRLAAFEMLYIDSVPMSVSINEAVELAKAFGGEDESHRFVNGVLGKIAATLSGEEYEETDEDE